jgi:hypothetical protein
MMTLSDRARIIRFGQKEDPSPDPMGYLVALEGTRNVPFDIARVFYTCNVPENTVRGQHAHSKCRQLLIAIYGTIEVECNDGRSKERFILNHPSKGLLVEPGIWAEQLYHRDSVLMVLCDQVYDEGDYIRSWDEFLARSKV